MTTKKNSDDDSSIHPLLIVLYVMIGLFVIIVIASLFTYFNRSAKSTPDTIYSEFIPGDRRENLSLTERLGRDGSSHEIKYKGEFYNTDDVRRAFHDMKNVVATQGGELDPRSRDHICSKMNLPVGDLCALLGRNAVLDAQGAAAPHLSDATQRSSAEGLINQGDMNYLRVNGKRYNVKDARSAFFDIAYTLLEEEKVDSNTITDICNKYSLDNDACNQLRLSVIDDYDYNMEELRKFTNMFFGIRL